MELILIRHAQSKGNKDNIVQGQIDEGLSELGKEQADLLSKYFDTAKITAIYSSDLGRALQTAEPTAKKLELKIKTDSDLREADFGIWEGLTYDEVKQKFQRDYDAWHKNYYTRPHWFESFQSHFERVKRAIEKILISHSLNNRVLVFTHGGSLKTQVGFFKNLSGEELTSFSNTNCSLTLLKFNPSKNYKDGEIIYFNKQVIQIKSNNLDAL